MIRDFTEEQKGIIKSGINQPFWQTLKGFLLKDVEMLTERITGDTNEDLSVEQRNHLINVRKVYKNLIELPDRMVSDKPQEPEKVNFDPYS